MAGPHVHRPGGGIKGREEPVPNEKVCPGKRPQERRFPSVGIAHQGGSELPFPSLALNGPCPGNLPELLLQVADSSPDESSVRFELGLPGAPQSNPASDSGEVAPHAPKPGEQVLQLCELHLHLGFPCSGSCREDVQDELRPVHHPDPEKVFQVLPLGR